MISLAAFFTCIQAHRSGLLDQLHTILWPVGQDNFLMLEVLTWKCWWLCSLLYHIISLTFFLPLSCTNLTYMPTHACSL